VPIEPPTAPAMTAVSSGVPTIVAVEIGRAVEFRVTDTVDPIDTLVEVDGNAALDVTLVAVVGLAVTSEAAAVIGEGVVGEGVGAGVVGASIGHTALCEQGHIAG
jgi:hypothetical protein